MNHCQREIERGIVIHLKQNPCEKKIINSESSKEEALRESYPLRSRKPESKTVNLVTKASNTFNKTTVNERYQQHNIRSKLPIPIWWKNSKELSNTREHPKTPFRLGKLNVLFSNGYSNRYGGRMENKKTLLLLMLKRDVQIEIKICMITTEG